MALVAISLGSNLGDRLLMLRDAVKALGEPLTVVGESRIYETEPMYVEDQPPFLNAAILVETKLGPLALLRLLKKTERTLGREISPRYGPREIDLDLITYGSARYRFFPTAHSEPTLTVPHPRVAERRFVLQPLYDMKPWLVVPGLGTVADLLGSTESDVKSVREISDALLSVLSR